MELRITEQVRIPENHKNCYEVIITGLSMYYKSALSATHDWGTHHYQENMKDKIYYYDENGTKYHVEVIE